MTNEERARAVAAEVLGPMILMPGTLADEAKIGKLMQHVEGVVRPAIAAAVAEQTAALREALTRQRNLWSSLAKEQHDDAPVTVKLSSVAFVAVAEIDAALAAAPGEAPGA